MKGFAIGTAVVALAVAASSASIDAQDSRSQTGTATSQRPAAPTPHAARTDAQGFIDDMTIAGIAEVQLGQLATERAVNADVKAFGQMMVKDHTQANNELKQIASQMKLETPTQLDQKHKDLVDKLTKLQGNEFDREYINTMVQGHQEVLGKLRARAEMKLPAPGAAAGEHPAGEHPANAAKPDANKPDAQAPGVGDTTGHGHGDQALTQWAAKAIPVVQKHLARAEEIQQKIAK
jgi:putative membrane protein